MEKQSESLPIVKPAQQAVPPDVKSLDPIENKAVLDTILDFLHAQGYSDASDVLITTIAYTTGEEEKLVAFKFDGTPVGPVKEFPRGYFVIPEDGANFDLAIVTYTASPGKVKGCVSSGGTIICN